MTREKRLFWALALVAGLVIIGTAIYFSTIAQHACDGVAGDSMLRFELVRSVAELQALFGTDPCRTTLANGFDAVNRIDVMVFIPAFTAFQLFLALALRGHGRWISVFIVNAALVAAACDLYEDQHLFALASQMRAGHAPQEMLLGPLFWLVRVKFALLALNCIELGQLLSRRGTQGARWSAYAVKAGGFVSLVGLYWHQLLGLGITIAWAIMLVVALLAVLRGPPSDTHRV
ncbi:MAG: hypothetical protein IT553_11070 [Sphingomonadaceae bacterium]|nr:hypothetical protein [Sphingomonadaceae bacterium]